MKRGLEQNLSIGILTVPNVAKLCAVSPPTVHKWLESGKLAYYKPPEINERRIAATVLVKFMTDRSMVIPPELKRAAEIFAADYNDDFSVKTNFVETAE